MVSFRPLSSDGKELGEANVRIRIELASLILVAGWMTPTTALAWGAPGCTNLPEYERALGALQGMTSACDMSVEQASRIVAARGNVPGGLFGSLLSGPPKPLPEAVPVSSYPLRQAVRFQRKPVHQHVAHRHRAIVR
ncbi:hypothetical protein KHHGKMAE_2378 [Methylobacterium persicinum]|nr:hypothetical protein KHHGKMAE_2378 [Methylobacterium persicinum]